MLTNFLTDKYDLNQGQKELVELLDKFLTNDGSCFLLKGYAGTGKTFLMKGLTELTLHKLLIKPLVLHFPNYIAS